MGGRSTAFVTVTSRSGPTWSSSPESSSRQSASSSITSLATTTERVSARSSESTRILPGALEWWRRPLSAVRSSTYSSWVSGYRSAHSPASSISTQLSANTGRCSAIHRAAAAMPSATWPVRSTSRVTSAK